MQKFGEKLQALRQQKKLSLRKLGDILGVSGSYIWELEKGEKIPNIAMLIKIADTFGVCSDRLIRDELELE